VELVSNRLKHVVYAYVVLRAVLELAKKVEGAGIGIEKGYFFNAYPPLKGG